LAEEWPLVDQVSLKGRAQWGNRIGGKYHLQG